MKIFAACPECGCTDWIRFNSGGFVCNGCGRLIFTEEMLRAVPSLPQRAYEGIRHLRGSQEQALPASWDATLLLPVEKSLPRL